MPLQPLIAPSLLSCDFANLGEESNRMICMTADYLHVDVMDGHFVPNLTIGPPIVKAIRKHCDKAFLDCHLMIENPEKWVEQFAKSGADNITFHWEATSDPAALIETIHDKLKVKASVSVKPGTPIETTVMKLLKDRPELVDKLHMVLIMTVEPGFGGQAFMADMMPKVRTLRQAYPDLNIQVDGGISEETIDAAAEAGANVVVAGSAIFGAKDPHQYILNLRAALQKHLSK